MNLSKALNWTKWLFAIAISLIFFFWIRGIFLFFTRFSKTETLNNKKERPEHLAMPPNLTNSGQKKYVDALAKKGLKPSTFEIFTFYLQSLNPFRHER